MNSVIEAQAHKLPEFDNNEDETEAHIYLERMQLPVDVQDQVLEALHSKEAGNTQSIESLIEEAMESHLSDFLSH